MDTTLKPRNRFCFIFFFLFLSWYFLLCNFDWFSFPHLSPISHLQQDLDFGSDSDSDTDSSSKDIDESSTTTIIQSSSSNASNSISISNASSLENPGVDRKENNREIEAMPDVEIIDKELEKEILANKRRKRKPCTGRHVYVHDVPSRFNEDYVVKQCRELSKWENMCRYFENDGLGPVLGDPQKLFTPTGWYDTSQFSLDVIFHKLMKQYECLTHDSSKANAIYVPYYAGLDVGRYLWDEHNSSVKDADALELVDWLKRTPEWQRMGGQDHFMVSGRITWDMRRVLDDRWGSKLTLLPETRNMMILTTESSPWDKNDFAIPYPTYFHPSGDYEVHAWQKRMRRRRRKTLFSFAGEPHPNQENSLHEEIIKQCAAAPRRRCRMIECKDQRQGCLKPTNLMRMYASSIFCLQPTGQSFTRQSTFNAIVAGCIPVFFSPGSAYVQYLWHLPRDFSSYSVLISEKDVKQGKVKIDRVLSRIPKTKVSVLRNKVIKLIPNVIYADPTLRPEKVDDAFDLAVEGVAARANKLREGREDFDPESSWKYFTFGTTEPHKWDHFFNRSQQDLRHRREHVITTIDVSI